MLEHAEPNDNEEDFQAFDYSGELNRLEDELRIWQYWIQKNGRRVVIVVEGRVAAGKSGAISSIVRPLPPRRVRVVALPDPSTREKKQWYFQRYISHLPAAGEIVIFDRSWYNRVLVDPFLSQAGNEAEIHGEDEIASFLRSATLLERILVNDGIILRKYWLSLSQAEQERRFARRAENRLLSWRLSNLDRIALYKYNEVTAIKSKIINSTDSNDLVDLRWRHVDAEDMERARLNIIHDILCNMHYEDVVPEPQAWQANEFESSQEFTGARKSGLYYVLDHYGLDDDE